MEEIRDADNHLICYVNSATGFIDHTFHKERMTAILPIGGEVVFTRGKCFTTIRRLDTGQLYVFSKRLPDVFFASA